MSEPHQLPRQDHGVCAAGRCEHCGCTFRKPSDVLGHRCAAMQEAEAMVEDPRHPGYVWPSWRDALLDAQKGIDTAYEHRRRMFKAANDAGISFADIGATVGLSAAGVHKIVGNTAKATLDDPAGSFSNEDADSPRPLIPDEESRNG